MAVIMVLVDDHVRTGCINDRNTQRTGAIDKPVVPSRPSHAKGWYFSHHTFGKYEIVTARRWMQSPGAGNLSSQNLLPIFILEVKSGAHFQIPQLAYHEEALRGDALNRCHQVGEKNDIGIHIRDESLPGHSLNEFKGRIEQGSSILIAGNVGKMLDAIFRRGLRHARIIAAENHLASRGKLQPALNGVPLDCSDMSLKRFRNGKNGQHRVIALTTSRPILIPH